jgi:hypothetical protein
VEVAGNPERSDHRKLLCLANDAKAYSISVSRSPQTMHRENDGKSIEKASVYIRLRMRLQD